MVEIWNWARTYSCRPRLYFEPKSVESLQEILKIINENQWKFRIIGCGHSPSSLALSDEVLISMKYFDQIIEINLEDKFVHCQSGVLIKSLNEILPSKNLSLPVQGSVSSLTIGGVISTGTHGSGIQFGTLSSYVRSICLMKLNGNIVQYDRNDRDNEDLFRCLTCSLGTFGILLSISIDLTDLFYLELTQHQLKFDDFLNHLSVHISSSDHFRYMWFPHTQSGIAYHLQRRSPTIPLRKENLFQRIYSSIRHRIIGSNLIWIFIPKTFLRISFCLGYHLLEILFYISLYFPRFVRWINRFYLNFEGQNHHQISRCDHLFNFDCLFRQYANEWAIPIEETVSCLVKLEEFIERNYFVHFPIEIRFGRSETSSFLSPSFQRETCWINTVAYRPFGFEHRQHRKYFEEFERICFEHSGRPHWAKEHSLTYSELSRLYPQWNLFHQYRRKFDPTNLLINSCLEKIFVQHE